MLFFGLIALYYNTHTEYVSDVVGYIFRWVVTDYVK